MPNINFSQIFKKNWIHLVAIGLFLVITFIYFQPQFTGHRLNQHDIEQYQGMSNETKHFREIYDEEPLWTNSMFGGMPTYQVSTIYEGNLLKKVTKFLGFGMKSPAGIFILYLIGFYIMLLCMRVNPKVAIFGALIFAFSSYFIIILQAGHNTKAAAIGLMGPVIGAFYMAYRYNLKWGILLSALFMGLQLSSNHFQITYYLGIVLVGLGVAELVRTFKKVQWKRFLTATVGILLAYFFALGINYGNVSLTNDYAKHTTRGGNDITINTDGTTNKSKSTTGLDKDYITQWSYGIGESMTLLSPNIKGGSSSAIQNSQFADKLRDPDMRRNANVIGQNNVYWGAQPFVSGPVYLGIIVFFLALLGMVYLKGPMKWALAAVTILALMLSWGKNFMGLTDFFLEYLPAYNKFRAVTIILAVVELTIPLLGVLFLNKLFKKREEIKNNIKPLFIVSGSLLGIIILLTFTGLGDGYLSPEEKNMAYNPEGYIESRKAEFRQQIRQEDPRVLEQNGIDINNKEQIESVIERQVPTVNQIDQQFNALVDFRKSIYQSSMGRSILFLIIGIVLVLIYLYTTVRKELILVGLALFTVGDLISVDLNYLNNKKQKNNRNYIHWIDDDDFEFPLAPTQADKQILQAETANDPALKKKIDYVQVKKEGRRGNVNTNALWSKKFQTLNMNTNYRVYESQAGFSSSRPAYFHKALNGYHGAKLRRIQNVKDFHIDKGNMAIFNMFNVKYFINQGKAQTNPNALGNGWFVKTLNVQPNPNMELLALGDLFLIENFDNSLELFVNGEKVTKDTITGQEKVFLVKNADTLFKGVSQITRSKMSSAFVRDVNGEMSWIPSRELEKDTLDSFDEIVKLQQAHSFNPKEEAIVSKEVADDVSSLQYSGVGQVAFTSYLPNELKYKVKSDDKQFLVLSEVYYPDGWKAYLDGEEIDIHRVNYLLRGLEIPAGDHELVMKFEVQKFERANNIALAGSLIIILLVLGFFVKDFVLKKNK
ncbi:MAG: YfhO family protein [Brumimicrobium sp.]